MVVPPLVAALVGAEYVFLRGPYGLRSKLLPAGYTLEHVEFWADGGFQYEGNLPVTFQVRQEDAGNLPLMKPVRNRLARNPKNPCGKTGPDVDLSSI